MKKLLLIVALVVTGLTVKAQDSKDIPSNITSSLSQKYPDAKDVDWARDNANYKADFSVGKKDYEVVFDSKGNWLSTDVDHLRAGDLPKEVQKGLDNSQYNNWEVGGVESNETPEDLTYKVEIRRGIKMRDLYFDKEGNMIRDKSKI